MTWRDGGERVIKLDGGARTFAVNSSMFGIAADNFTQIVGETWSWYSTSASASAVRSTGLHITGFEPR